MWAGSTTVATFVAGIAVGHFMARDAWDGISSALRGLVNTHSCSARDVVSECSVLISAEVLH